MRGTSEPKVLVVDDEPESLNAAKRALTPVLKDALVCTSSPAEAMGLLSTTPFSVLIVDQMMPQLSGSELLREAMRLQPSTKRVLLTAHLDLNLVTQGMNDGDAQQVLSKPYDAFTLRTAVAQLRELYRLEQRNLALVEQLQAAHARLTEKEQLLSRTLEEREQALVRSVDELRGKNRLLEQLALRDGLTGLYNHRCFQERLREELARSARSGQHVSLVLLDVDRFKWFNDTFGHPVGDQVLRIIAAALTGEQPWAPRGRKSDIAARYGGEEFALILPDTAKDGGRVHADRLRRAIASAPLPVVDGVSCGPVTASFGVASYPEDAQNAEELIGRADRALVWAKQEGRNRVVVWAAQADRARVVLGHPREALGELGTRLREDGHLAVVSVQLADYTRLERRYGRSASQRVAEAFRRIALSVSDATLGRSDIVATVSPSPDVMDVFVAPPRAEGRGRHTYLDQVAELMAQRVEQQLVGELATQELGLLRVVGAHCTQLLARSLPVEHQLERVSSAVRTELELAFGQRRAQDRLQVQRTILERLIHAEYQPVYAADGQRRLGFEALSRGPKGSELESPLWLLEVAEDAGLLPELDVCMLAAALSGARGLEQEELLFVNVLSSTALEPSLFRTELPALLDAAKLSTRQVVLEITERQESEDLSQLARALDLARGAGFKVGLDDVGSRHANLVEIAALRPDWLKLDRKLLAGVHQEPMRQDLVRAIADFARRQSIQVIAEGVELEGELAFVRETGLAYVQGFLLGRPGRFVEGVGWQQRGL